MRVYENCLSNFLPPIRAYFDPPLHFKFFFDFPQFFKHVLARLNLHSFGENSDLFHHFFQPPPPPFYHDALFFLKLNKGLTPSSLTGPLQLGTREYKRVRLNGASRFTMASRNPLESTLIHPHRQACQ